VGLLDHVGSVRGFGHAFAAPTHRLKSAVDPVARAMMALSGNALQEICGRMPRDKMHLLDTSETIPSKNARGRRAKNLMELDRARLLTPLVKGEGSGGMKRKTPAAMLEATHGVVIE